ncbi:hypothetical protein [Paenibacillus albus]|uniref:Uncharacterized protein n=1 Tax=Paenibacillus albus TaxID=2495582 RepID=A0A3Q8X741_9BACL|nr:hypothetical protein [Paenibacillus albus]AZN41212.1 hypothetical protein EJC50_17195 [Paenibacillus albus]
MSINFTKAIVSKLQRDIADIESNIVSEKNKLKKAQAKIKQLERDMKLSQSHNDLSSKMTRINKLTEEIKISTHSQADLNKQLASKKASLNQHQSKEPK